MRTTRLILVLSCLLISHHSNTTDNPGTLADRIQAHARAFVELEPHVGSITYDTWLESHGQNGSERCYKYYCPSERVEKILGAYLQCREQLIGYLLALSGGEGFMVGIAAATIDKKWYKGEWDKRRIWRALAVLAFFTVHRGYSVASEPCFKRDLTKSAHFFNAPAYVCDFLIGIMAAFSGYAGAYCAWTRAEG
jgi:hypothetical protein